MPCCRMLTAVEDIVAPRRHAKSVKEEIVARVAPYCPTKTAKEEIAAPRCSAKAAIEETVVL